MNRLKKGALTLAAVGTGAWLLSRWLRGAGYDFRGKVVLITGGTRGLGLVMARKLTAEEARVAVCARDEAEVKRAGDELARYTRESLAVACDVTDPERVRDLVRTVEERFGPIDVLINNAGTIMVGPLKTMTRQDFEEALAVAFWGAYNTVEAVLPGMRERRQGRIVNISSVGGKISIPHLLPYSVGKFALVGYSNGLRAELANNGIVVTTVCPGLMRTGSPRNAFFKGQHEAEYAWFSIGDSLPLLTISAEKAARQIVDACRYGYAEVVLSWPAQVAVKLHALVPELGAALLSLANRLLPRPGDAGTERHRGAESQSPASPSALTALTERAAQRNNEIVPTT